MVIFLTILTVSISLINGLVSTVNTRNIWKGGIISIYKLSALSIEFDADSLEVGTEIDVMKSIDMIRKMAASRRHLDEMEKMTVLKLITSNIYNLDAVNISYCIWALGILKITKNKMNENMIDIIFRSINKAFGKQDSIDALRIMTGLSKMGFDWYGIPPLIRMGLVYNILPESGDIDVSPTSIQVDNGAVSTLIYNLGLLKVSKEDLPQSLTESLLSHITLTLNSDNVQPQSLANTLWGLGRINCTWANIPEELRTSILTSTVNFARNNSMSVIETASIFHSFAKLEVHWSDLPPSVQDSLFKALARGVYSMTEREVTNCIWSMGKLDIRWTSLPENFKSDLLHQLERKLPKLVPYDLESVFVGLGLMRVSFRSLPPSLQSSFDTEIAQRLHTMNIFCVHNVLWGLARMSVRIHDGVLTDELVDGLLERTIEIFHTFLPEHFGDVLWSLGSLGYYHENMRQGPSQGMDRLQAILSRVIMKLPARDGVFAIWGLAKMGVNWGDIKAPKQSHESSVLSKPLSESVNRFLKTRIGGLKEKEYTTLLYALGLMNTYWNIDLSPNVTEKIQQRLGKVSRYLSPRSISSGTWGLGRMRVTAQDLDSAFWNEWTRLITAQLPNMNAVELSQTLHGLALMRFGWSGLDGTLRDAIYNELNKKASKLTDYCLKTLLWSLAEMSCKMDNLPPNLIDSAKGYLTGKFLQHYHIRKESGYLNEGAESYVLEYDDIPELETSVSCKVLGISDSVLEEKKHRLLSVMDSLARCGMLWQNHFSSEDRHEFIRNIRFLAGREDTFESSPSSPSFDDFDQLRSYAVSELS